MRPERITEQTPIHAEDSADQRTEGSHQRIVRRPFPIMGEAYRAEGQITSIPWEMIEPHEAQAVRNHYQTLKRLAERGGLCPLEAVAVLQDRKYHERWPSTIHDRETAVRLTLEANNILKEMVSSWRPPNDKISHERLP